MDDAELEKAYDAHASGLFRYLLGFTKCEADARDLLQDLFIKLARGVKDPALNQKALVYRIAHNLAIDWLRRQAARGDVKQRLLGELDSNPRCSHNPDSDLLATSFASAMQTLPEEQLAVVQLRLFDGLTFEEIAAVQEVPLNTAASRWHYAIEKLRFILRPLYEEII
jgi:RNA polymerase sigma-70 factor (ECF subfamily)